MEALAKEWGTCFGFQEGSDDYGLFFWYRVKE